LARGAFAPSAHAARNIQTRFADSAFASDDPAKRSAATDKAVGEDARVIRIDVSWASVAGDAPPANPADPSDPGYDFSNLDASISDADARGLDVLLTVFRAPKWAEGPNRPPESDQEAPKGTWKPDPDAFGKFGAALAARYSGNYPNPDGSGTLPQVTHFEAWNEENLWVYLSPQYTNDGKNVAVEHYRSLLNAFYAGVHQSNPKAKVVLGGAALIDRHPDTRFIVDHMAILQPRTPPAPPNPWADLPKVLELAKRRNAVIKVSGACTLSHKPYPFPDIWDPIRRLIDAWGVERCLWGTDWTRAFAVVNYEQAVKPFLETDRLGASERAMLMGGACAKAYGWSPGTR
jgi:hypothetical protein